MAFHATSTAVHHVQVTLISMLCLHMGQLICGTGLSSSRQRKPEGHGPAQALGCSELVSHYLAVVFVVCHYPDIMILQSQMHLDGPYPFVIMHSHRHGGRCASQASHVAMDFLTAPSQNHAQTVSISMCVQAILIAAEKFDFSKGTRFPTLAAWYVRAACVQHLQQHSIMHVPKGVQQLVWKVQNAVKSFREDNDGRTPSQKQIADLTGLSMADVSPLALCLHHFRPALASDASDPHKLHSGLHDHALSKGLLEHVHVAGRAASLKSRMALQLP